MNRTSTESESQSKPTERTALIVGGTGGIGSACVRHFVGEGFKVGYTGHRSAALNLERGAEATDEHGPRYWRLDLASDSEIFRLVQNVKAELGFLDALVMCQGVIAGKTLREYSNNEIDNVFYINTISMIKLTKSLHPLLKPNSSVVCMSSISAFAGSHDPVYAASKGAVVSFVKAMARQFGPEIRVNAVAPGLTEDTGMFRTMDKSVQKRHQEATALKRLATPRAIANVVGFLCSENAAHITGSCLDVNGGEYLR